MTLNVIQVRLAIGTPNHFQMEIDIRLLAGIQHFEQIAAELFASWAGEPFLPPNGADGMITAFPLLHGEAEFVAEIFVGAE